MINLAAGFDTAGGEREPIEVLFVCTGNIFRSMAAEQFLRAKAQAMGLTHLRFSSAGTRAKPDKGLHEVTLRRLEEWGLSGREHTPRKLDAEILQQADLVVAMSKVMPDKNGKLPPHDPDCNHQAFILKNFKRAAPVFKEVCLGKDEALPDLPEVIPDHASRPEAAARFIERTIDFIGGNAERFIHRVPLFLNPAQPAYPVRYPAPAERLIL